MDFQINGETYFVTVGEDARDWLVFVSTATGARAIPVYEDASECTGMTLVVEDKDRRKIVN